MKTKQTTLWEILEEQKKRKQELQGGWPASFMECIEWVNGPEEMAYETMYRGH